MVKKFLSKFKKKQGDGARKAVLQELFNDLNSSRKEVYMMNFFRGIFFGVGSVLGGTVVVALAIGILSWFTDIPGGVGDFVQSVVDTVEQSDESDI